ncbi:hypothetical protein SAY86_020403 [Trapa natans]|uniref:Uncharacterized protein n=1 Tax=Trapa natans TaxID=22666 RepID=A0AAN7LPS0_TRANT|nr:hypothetical protein SAY86_020403 [Trapa natans]
MDGMTITYSGPLEPIIAGLYQCQGIHAEFLDDLNQEVVGCLLTTSPFNAIVISQSVRNKGSCYSALAP